MLPGKDPGPSEKAQVIQDVHSPGQTSSARAAPLPSPEKVSQTSFLHSILYEVHVPHSG